ncbi:subtilisin family serine protease [Agromyces sp. 3263]|uniref:S8 family serine peptidase n=1 Tax=Agromyces sp. 3263 TaxID=2817750 RepID=UPI00285BA8F3|nr:S8 family serine peptidase [Agromyces sp. 3263]MDR6907715.1 subtilisin family serine protease [Agromyces sp. 3263]
MPRRTPPSPIRRTRAIAVAAAISGLAIGVGGVGTALPAVAGPVDGGSGGGGSAPAAASPTGEHRVTLITGDRVTVTDLSDGRQTVEIDPAVEGGGVQTVQVGDDLIVLPQQAMPYVASGALDRDLLNVTKLIEFGYDDASVAATPVILELADGPVAMSAEPLPGVEVGAALPSIDAAAAVADHASAASTWAALTDAPAGPGLFSAEPGAKTFGGGIEAIHLDGKVQATLDSSVPWIGAPEAWAAGYTGTGVTVAVLDTGYDDTHPDLAGHVLPESTSFVPGEEVAFDPHGHGTHVASTIAGTGAASGGTHRGVADGADLLVGKVLGNDGYGQDSWIIEAMEWAGQRAPIVSMSLGSSEASDGEDLLAEALNTVAEQTGTLFVVAAGNAGAPETIGTPGSAASALTVGSVDDPSGALSYFSSQGPLTRSGALKPDLSGPGNDVTAARSADSEGEGAYTSKSGTSMATPHVAGAAAILKQQHPEYTAAQLRAALTSTATDTGMAPYQGGSGVVNVAAAVESDLVASGSGDFGMLTWGEEPELVVRTIEYTNRGDAEATVSLEASLVDTTPGTGGEEGPGPLSVGEASEVLSLDADSLTIPAGETRSVTLTADPAAVPAGVQLSGALVASVDGVPVTRTALGIIAESERYDLEVTATGLDGEPTHAVGWIWNPETEWYDIVQVDGSTTLRLPAGDYALMTYMDVAPSADSQGVALVGDPHVVLDGSDQARVAFDARAAKKVSVDVGERGLESLVMRMDYLVDGFGGSMIAPVWADDLYAQPIDASDAEEFSFTTRWRLQHPNLVLKWGTKTFDVTNVPGATMLDHEVKGAAVGVGLGSAEEFAAVDVRGKVAVALRSDAVSPVQRAANAAAAGAALLVVVNDADGEFNEWVGAEDGSRAAVAVATVSGVEGRPLLDALAGTKSVKVTATGVANSDEVWDVVRYSEDEIPADLAYRPTDLARIDTTYHGRQGDLVGEYRYDFTPNGMSGAGYPQRAARGVERTEWVSTDDVRWYQGVFLVDGTWGIRDVQRTYEPGSVNATSYFGPIVRPYVGRGFWAPNRQGAYVQVNVASWADGGEPEHTGGFDTWAGIPGIVQHSELYVNGEFVKASEYQGLNYYGLPDGDSELRIVNVAEHDGTWLDSSTSTTTEWTVTSTGTADVYAAQLLPMLQATYDVEVGADARVGDGRKKGATVPLGFAVGHVSGAAGSGMVTDATLEVRLPGGDWTPVDIELASTLDEGPGEMPLSLFPTGRAYVASYEADLRVPDAGGWVDLRVTASDAAGNTFSQEIERAFEAAPAKGAGHGGHVGGSHGGRP